LLRGGMSPDGPTDRSHFRGAGALRDCRKSNPTPRLSCTMAPRKQVPLFQFKIVLEGAVPPVWRRIQIPADCTFRDLHVAVQDSMGWSDCRLHEFTARHPVEGVGRIGIPSPDGDDFGEPPLPGWKEKVSGWLTLERNTAMYEYDFGDGPGQYPPPTVRTGRGPAKRAPCHPPRRSQAGLRQD